MMEEKLKEEIEYILKNVSKENQAYMLLLTARIYALEYFNNETKTTK